MDRYRRVRSRGAPEPVALPSHPPVLILLAQAPDAVLRDLNSAIAPTRTLTDQVLGAATADRIQLFRGVPSYTMRDVLVFEGHIADDGRAIVGRFRLSGRIWFYCVVASVFLLVAAPPSLPRALRLALLFIGVPLIPAVAWRIGATDRSMILDLLRRVAQASNGTAA